VGVVKEKVVARLEGRVDTIHAICGEEEDALEVS
jgi:hypothetical protein